MTSLQPCQSGNSNQSAQLPRRFMESSSKKSPSLHQTPSRNPGRESRNSRGTTLDRSLRNQRIEKISDVHARGRSLKEVSGMEARQLQMLPFNNAEPVDRSWWCGADDAGAGQIESTLRTRFEQAQASRDRLSFHWTRSKVQQKGTRVSLEWSIERQHRRAGEWKDNWSHHSPKKVAEVAIGIIVLKVPQGHRGKTQLTWATLRRGRRGQELTIS